MRTLKSLFIIVSFFVLLSCKKDPYEIIQSSLDKRAQVESVTFKHISFEKLADNIRYSEDKVYVKIDDTNPLGAVYRIESHDGKIEIYNGENFATIDHAKKSAFVVSYRYKPSQFAEKYFKTISNLMIMNFEAENKAYQSRVYDYIGSARVDGINCDIIQQNANWFDEESNITEEHYIGNDGFVRKINFQSYANDNSIVKTKDIFRDIIVNSDLPDSLFSINIPIEYKKEFYRPRESSGKEYDNLLELGSEAPDWILPTGNNDSLSLSKFKGTPVILDFWGTWCVWCVVAMPKLNDVYNAFKDYGLEVIGISCKEKEGADPVKFMKDKQMNYKVVLSGDSVADQYKVSGFPTIYIIGSDGKIKFAQAGYDSGLDSVLTNVIIQDPVIANKLEEKGVNTKK